jgi:hypothetical protein
MAFPELAMLMLFLGGPAGTDSLTIIDPVQYFTSRQVDVSIDKMASLAAEAPRDAKTQVRQLLALRYLTDHADKLKQADRYTAHHKLLVEIAAGKTAQDPQAFAKEYAEMVLARLDGKTLEAPAAPKLQDAFAWFPADAAFVAAADTRPGRGGPPPLVAPSELLKKLPDRSRDKLFEMIEKVGNVRFDRVAIAYVPENNPEKGKIYTRFTGKGNPAWLASFIKEMEPRVQEMEHKGPDGRPITVLREPNHAPAITFLGDSEMLLVGYTHEQARHEDLIEEMLAIRAGKQPNATGGPLKARLQKVPAKAIACVIGNLPEEMRKDIGRDLQKLGATAPVKIDAHVEKVPAGYDASVTAEMANAGEAQTAVMQIGKLRKEGIDALQQMLKQPDANPRVPANALINVLESLQMQSEGPELRLRLLVPRDIVQGLPAWFAF